MIDLVTDEVVLRRRCRPNLPSNLDILSSVLTPRSRRSDASKIVIYLSDLYGSLADILSVPEHVLSQDPRVGPAAARSIATLKRTIVEAAFAPLRSRPALGNCRAVVAYLQWVIGREQVEEVRVLYLDAKMAVTSDEVLSRGTGCKVAVTPAQVARSAVRAGASGIIIAHNHPSGNVDPSSQDIEMTDETRKTCEGVGVQLIDHLIVGHGEWYSFRTNGMLFRRDSIS